MNSPRFKSQIKKLIPIFLWIPILISCQSAETDNQSESTAPPKGFTIPVIDVADQTHRQIVVDREEGQYRVRLMDNKHNWDCAYPGVEVLPDGTFVLVTYGHWVEGEMPFVMCVRLMLKELDEMAEMFFIDGTVSSL